MAMSETTYPEMRNALKGLLAGQRFSAGSDAERAARTVVDQGIAALDEAGKATFKSVILPMLNEGEGLADRAREVADTVSAAASDAADRVEERFNTLSDLVAEEVSQRPYRALAIAAGMGFAAALFMVR